MSETNDSDSMSILKEGIKGLVDTCQDVELLDLVWKLLAEG